MAPLLSVIVPAYGVGEYLPSCIDSILASTLEDLEVIVVDDGSPDECGEIADDYASVDDRVRVLHTENQGLGPARNTGAEVATGKYLTFADSDDLLPPRAYELLVTSLERTGSDIAAGNTWRYIEGRGNVQSWTHKDAFAETKLSTHVREYPVLIRDRMVWNKVYRRTFWDAGGYQFPPIRYEDYPVTLPAHLEASTVDVLSDKVYLWRQRLAEDSITQRSLELDNLKDRITSASMTLDIADAEGGEIRDRLHAYFIDVDIITLATALIPQEPDPDDPDEELRSQEEYDEIAQLTVSFARRVEPLQDEDRPTALAKLIHRALRDGEVGTAAALARWRRDHDGDALRKALATPRTVLRLPAIMQALGPGTIRLPQLKDRKLKSRVMEIVRVDDGYQVQVEVRLRRLLLDRATITAHLRSEDERRVELESTVAAINGQRATLVVALPDDQLVELGDDEFQLAVRLVVGPLTWTGPVNLARNDMPEPSPLPDGGWSVVSRPRSGEHDAWVRRVNADAVVDAEIADGRLRVHVGGSHEMLAILRPAPSEPLLQAVEDGVAAFPLDSVLDDPADDPVTSIAYRDVVAVEPARADELGEASAARLVGDATGSGADRGAAKTNGDAVEAATGGAVSTEETASVTDEGVNAGEDVADTLAAAGITPLVVNEYSRDRVEWGEHVISLQRSASGTLEIRHQRIDHLPHR